MDDNKKKTFHYNSWKKIAPKVDKDAAALHMKVVVKKDGDRNVTSIIISDKDNPFFGKKLGDKVAIKGEYYKVVAIRSVKANNANAKDKKTKKQ